MPSLFLSFIAVNVTDWHVTDNLETLPLFCVGDDLYGFLFPTLLSLCLHPAAYFQLQNHKLLHREYFPSPLAFSPPLPEFMFA